MKKYILLLFILAFIVPLVTYSQNDKNNANIWYFGNKAGIDFNPSTPIGLSDGQLDTQEGVSTICNEQGSLLFYSDGNTIWDKTHNSLPNGTGLNGHWSSTQSGIIVPNLIDTNKYYIFTVDELGGSHGLCYSEIDVSLPGNGTTSNPLGDVSPGIKNIQLVTPVTEKLTAVLKPNLVEYWVITHYWGNKDFYAYEVTQTGVNTTPVISSAGVIHTGGSINTVGYLKGSPLKDKLALVYRGTNSVYLYDFDNITGIVSNETQISLPGYLLYGIEFSKNGDYLFIAGEQNIIRYNVNTTVIDSVYIDDMSPFSPLYSAIRALQLGPNGEIYVSIRYHDYLSVIHDPEAANPVLTVDGVFLDVDGNGRNCRFGLPNIFYYKGWYNPSSNNEVDKIDIENINLYPNPSYRIFNLTNNNFSNIQIYNINGIKVKTIDNLENLSTIQIDLKNEKPGIYLVKIKKNNKYIFEKIILEH